LLLIGDHRVDDLRPSSGACPGEQRYAPRVWWSSGWNAVGEQELRGMKFSFARRTRGRWLVVVLAAVAVVLGTALPAAATTSGWGPDPTFATNLGIGFNNAVTPVVRQADGRLLVGGSFTSLNGTAINRLARLNADGTPDTAFNANLGTGFDALVGGVAMQADGKVLVAGNFTTFNGVTVNHLVRLNTDGTRDAAFSTALGTAFNLNTLRVVVQPDGKILVSGIFTSFNGVATDRLIRLNADGTRDSAFSTALGTGFNNSIVVVVVQPDGKIVTGGTFTTVNGAAAANLARLNADGTRDTRSRPISAPG
jgi:uncharacterized delta-60 repeat protein